MTEVICRKAYPIFFSVIFLVGLSGCVATRQWVSDQIAPVAGRVSEGENRMGEMGGKMSGLEGRLGQTDARLSETGARLSLADAKAESALQSLANLRLERRFVLDMKEGATFTFNSAGLTAQAKREIDSFLSDLRGDLKETEAIFVVAGHTDSAGADNYNYELGRKRADTVARHLILSKKVDPMRVVPVSYGESAPLAQNTTRDGRKRNRRVEILVYSERITAGSATKQGQAAPQSKESDERVSQR
ncbi:MAG: OmpA family protein [Candidatus Binatia bacterium]